MAEAEAALSRAVDRRAWHALEPGHGRTMVMQFIDDSQN
jgi:hypothetical protein